MDTIWEYLQTVYYHSIPICIGYNCISVLQYFAQYQEEFIKTLEDIPTKREIKFGTEQGETFSYTSLLVYLNIIDDSFERNEQNSLFYNNPA